MLPLQLDALSLVQPGICFLGPPFPAATEPDPAAVFAEPESAAVAPGQAEDEVAEAQPRPQAQHAPRAPETGHHLGQEQRLQVASTPLRSGAKRMQLVTFGRERMYV